MVETKEEKGQRKSDAKILFLKTVINFAKLVTAEQGKLLEHTAGFGYIHTVRELYNFESFSFYVDLCQTTIGGNELKVWYHPDKSYEQGLPAVLNVWWQLEVSTAKGVFESNRKWQNELLRTIKRQQKDRGFVDKQVVGYSEKRVLSQYEEEMRQKHKVL